MQVAHSLQDLANDTARSVVSIGNFDGVHCGHRLVIASVLARARELGARSVVVTFDPHPSHVLEECPPVPLITPLAQKLDLLAATGIEGVLVLPFTEELRCWSAQQFAERVLQKGLHAVEIHEGETFRFGRDAEADTRGLALLGQQLGFSVRAYEPYVLRGGTVSSSRVRSLLASGDVAHARALLGRSFSIRSTPAEGRGYGTRYAVPTINLAPYANLLPSNGVYVTTLRIGDGPRTRVFRSVTNAGNRPSFGADSFAVETHLLDFEPIPLTHETPLELTFLHRLRSEQRFASPEGLRAQIARDVQRAQRYFSLCDALRINLS